MTKFKTKIMSIIMALTLCIGCSLIVSGLGLYYANTSSGVKNEVEAYCLIGTKANGEYGTKSGKALKNCKVRMQEGNYDSGWVEGTAWGSTSSGYNRAYLSRVNNPLYTCYANWSWIY